VESIESLHEGAWLDGGGVSGDFPKTIVSLKVDVGASCRTILTHQSELHHHRVEVARN